MGVPRGELRLPLMAWSASEPRDGNDEVSLRRWNGTKQCDRRQLVGDACDR
jgi:hypothetical protein